MTLAYTFLLLAANALAQPMEPWAQNNNGRVTEQQKQQTGGVPIQDNSRDRRGQSRGASSNQSNPAQQILQQVLGGGKESEFAEGGNYSNTTFTGPSNGIDRGTFAGTGLNGMPHVNLNGCTTAKNKFQFKSGNGGEAGCEPKLTVSEEYANFLENNLSRCVSQAAGVSYFEVGKVWNAGTLPSKEHLLKSPNSLHNYGMALDITAIKIDNRMFDVSDGSAESKRFFNELRICWGNAVENDRNGCLSPRKSGLPHGSVGEEDDDHRGHHLHLSLPFCPQQARALGGVNIATLIFMNWFVSMAMAQNVDGLPVAKLTYKSIAVAGGTAKLTLKDTNGEPVSAGYRISVDLNCAKGKNSRLLDHLPTCQFDEIRYNKKEAAIEVLYRTSVMDEGRVACRKPEKKKLPVKCD